MEHRQGICVNTSFNPTDIENHMPQDISATVNIPIQLVDPRMPLPKYAHPGDAGADLCTRQSVELKPGERVVVGTGIAMAIPDGFVGLIHPRSGLAARTGLTIVNAPGTVDSGYRGEIKVCLLNTDSKNTISLRRGDRIAQLVIQKVERAQFNVVPGLEESARGADGYGSTGGSAALDGQ